MISTRSSILSAGASLALFMAMAPAARAAEASPFDLELGIGLREIAGAQDFRFQAGSASSEIRPSIDTLAVEARMGAVWRPSSGATYRVGLRYARNTDQGRATAVNTVTGADYTEGHSHTRGTLDDAELRAAASIRLIDRLEAGPWVAFGYRETGITLSDTHQTTLSMGYVYTSDVAGPTFKHREAWKTLWLGAAASWQVLDRLRIGGEVGLSPLAASRHRNQNLTTSALLTGDLTGTGWRVGGEVAWTFSTADRVGLSVSYESLTAEGTQRGTLLAGPNQGTNYEVPAKLSPCLWGVAVAWTHVL